MNFTREPIIETVIMPREGCKLLVRNSKGSGREDYFVDSVEVVSFGHSFFFRSLEKPKSFLVPVSDYEVLEQKETRLALRNAPMERSIKIGGGREPSGGRQSPENFPDSDYIEPTDRPPPQQGHSERDRKRDKRRRGRRGGMRDAPPQREMRSSFEELPIEDEMSPQGMRLSQEMSESQLEGSPALEPKAPSFISRLFPPPSTLIKETLSRYKPAEEEGEFPEKKDDDLLEEPPFPPKPSQNSDDDESSLED